MYIYENIVPFNATYRRWVLTNKILSVTGYNSFFGISVDIYRYGFTTEIYLTLCIIVKSSDLIGVMLLLVLADTALVFMEVSE